LNVQTGATEAHLDLSNLKVNSMDFSVGAANAWIRLPQAAGPTIAHISSGAATITLEVPQGVAAQIHHSGGLSTVDIDHNLARTNGVYASLSDGRSKSDPDTFTTWTGYQQHGLSSSPGFVDGSAHDYRLKSTSPAIDAGIRVPGITDTWAGDAPDLGRYERLP